MGTTVRGRRQCGWQCRRRGRCGRRCRQCGRRCGRRCGVLYGEKCSPRAHFMQGRWSSVTGGMHVQERERRRDDPSAAGRAHSEAAAPMDRRAGFGGGAKPDFGAAARGVCYRPKCSRRGVTMQEPDTQGTPTTEVDTHVGCSRSPAQRRQDLASAYLRSFLEYTRHSGAG